MSFTNPQLVDVKYWYFSTSSIIIRPPKKWQCPRAWICLSTIFLKPSESNDVFWTWWKNNEKHTLSLNTSFNQVLCKHMVCQKCLRWFVQSGVKHIGYKWFTSQQKMVVLIECWTASTKFALFWCWSLEWTTVPAVTLGVHMIDVAEYAVEPCG